MSEMIGLPRTATIENGLDVCITSNDKLSSFYGYTVKGVLIDTININLVSVEYNPTGPEQQLKDCNKRIENQRKELKRLNEINARATERIKELEDETHRKHFLHQVKLWEQLAGTSKKDNSRLQDRVKAQAKTIEDQTHEIKGLKDEIKDHNPLKNPKGFLTYTNKDDIRDLLNEVKVLTMENEAFRKARDEFNYHLEAIK